MCIRFGKQVKYTPKQTSDYEKLVKASYTAVSRTFFKKDIPLEINITAFFNGKFSNGIVSTTGVADLPGSKYYDLYEYGTTYEDQMAYDRGKIGDFTRELNPSNSKTWNGDYIRFIHSSWPIAVRGDTAISESFNVRYICNK